MKARAGHRRARLLRLLALLLLCAAGAAARLRAAHRADDRRRPAVHHLPAQRGLAAAGGKAAHPVEPGLGGRRPHLRPPQARRDRQRGRRLRRPLRRRVGRHREGLGAQPARRGARRTRLGPAPARTRRQPPKLVGGSTITQQLAKNLFLSGERTVLRKGQELLLTLMLEGLLSQAAHPGDLPQQRRVGRRRVRRPGRGAALLPRRRGAAGARAGGAAGGDAAGAQALREAARLGLRGWAARRPSWRAWARWSCHERARPPDAT